jgi:hypothetical protein
VAGRVAAHQAGGGAPAGGDLSEVPTDVLRRVQL